MSGLQNYKDTVQSFASSTDAVSNFLGNYDAEFFNNWKEKIDDVSSKIEAGRKIGEGIGETYLGAKALHATYKGFVKKYATNQNSEGGSRDNTEPSDDAEYNQGLDADTSNLEASNEMQPISRQLPRPAESRGNAQDSIMEQDPESTVSGLSEGGTEAAETTTAALTEGGSELLGTIGTIAGGVGLAAAEALPVVGLLGALGVGIYEAAKKHPHRPAAPKVNTSVSLSTQVMPSYDSVTDLPASITAF